MAVTTKMSFIIAFISSILIFSGMQIYKPWLTSSKLHTLFAGYLGSIFFVLCLTTIANLETVFFNKSYQVKLFPEVTLSLLTALLISASIHRVSGTSCLLISLAALYYINKYSQRVYVQSAPVVVHTNKKKKNTTTS